MRLILTEMSPDKGFTFLIGEFVTNMESLTLILLHLAKLFVSAFPLLKLGGWVFGVTANITVCNISVSIPFLGSD